MNDTTTPGNSPTRHALLISTDAGLRAELSALVRKHFPGTPIKERRDLRDNQTVWDIRAQNFALLLIDCRVEDRDELEFLASLNSAGYGSTAVIGITTAAQIPAIHSMNVGAIDFLDRGNLDQAQFVETVRRAWRQSGTGAVQSLPEAGSLLPPELAIKGYQPIKTLSVTTESCVLLVRRASNNQQFVLKFLPDTSNERLVKRFLQECRIATSQHHNSIVNVEEQGLSSGAAFYVMEFLAGGSLQSALQQRFSLQKTLRTLHQMAAALQHLHRNNIMHLDVKSANILFRDEKTAVLIDFGAARHQLIERNYTLKDHALGTPHYMSPEQATGRPLDQRSDLYALGIVFFEMLTGACPYQGDTISEVLYRHLRSPIPELPLHVRVFQPIINRLLAKKMGDRYADTGELLQALSTLTEDSGARTIESVTELPPLSSETLPD